jgi:hypothetical protein
MPVTTGPSAANGIEQVNVGLAQQAKNNLQAVNPGVDPTRPRFEQQNFLDTLRQELEMAQQEASQGIEGVDQEQLDVNSVDGVPVMASYFSLAKVAQFQSDPMMSGDSAGLPMTDPAADPMADPSMGQPQSDLQSQFNSPQELQALLDQNADNPDFVNEIVQSAPTDSQSLVRDAVQRYYEPERDPADKTIIAAEVFKAIHGRGQGEETVDATYTQASAENAVNETLKIIEAFAKKAASSQKLNKKASYNLKKEAQYGVNRNGGSEFINFGPESRRVFPHSNTGLLGSEWHNWIRGRDHNFIFDDRAFDFETFWRGNIMDKYSQPYRNDKGEWVGGYINKRFDVDRNIPEGNNLQLLPGQRRRPYLPEFATIEARMEASRKKMAEDRRYEPTDTEAKPYNWKEAAVKKK